MRDKDLLKFLIGKFGTGRPVDFRIRLGNPQMLISDRNIGSWGRIFPNREVIKTVGELTDKEITMLGYSSIDEYLSEPFNKGMTRDSLKKFIFWDEYELFGDKIRQILTK